MHPRSTPCHGRRSVARVVSCRLRAISLGAAAPSRRYAWLPNGKTYYVLQQQVECRPGRRGVHVTDLPSALALG
jgi:hypothetical protein